MKFLGLPVCNSGVWSLMADRSLARFIGFNCRSTNSGFFKIMLT